ncbi:MAG: hypothetical protein WCA20_32545 [Candidatus Sulfotelmatobacter sp.]
MTEPREPASLLPNANNKVALSVSQGSTRMKVCAGVFSISTAPAPPPIRLTASRGTIMRRGTFNRLRYAPPLPTAAVHRAIVFVALAGIGGTPVNSSAGNAMKLPPPATEFSAPPQHPSEKENDGGFEIQALRCIRNSGPHQTSMGLSVE